MAIRAEARAAVAQGISTSEHTLVKSYGYADKLRHSGRLRARFLSICRQGERRLSPEGAIGKRRPGLVHELA